MAHLWAWQIVSRISKVTRNVTVIAILGLIAASGRVAAADLSGDVSVQSEIRLIEETGDADYARYTITISTRDGSSSLTLVKDDDETQLTMPFQDCLSLWQYLRERDIGNLGNAPLENAYPGQSLFKFSFQVGSAKNAFSAYGVDFLSDTRYREIARAIMAAAEAHRPK